MRDDLPNNDIASTANTLADRRLAGADTAELEMYGPVIALGTPDGPNYRRCLLPNGLGRVHSKYRKLHKPIS